MKTMRTFDKKTDCDIMRTETTANTANRIGRDASSKAITAIHGADSR